MSAIAAEEIYGQLAAAAKEMPEVPRIHTVYYVTGTDREEEEAMLTGIARRTMGKFRNVEAAGAGEAAKGGGKGGVKGKASGEERRGSRAGSGGKAGG